ncbi:MAG: penicillin-binding transpeptidase domain-containing protein [Bacillota bacterium]
MRSPSTTLRNRVLHLLIVFLLALAMLVGRLGYIQLVRGDDLAEEAEELRVREITLDPRRGSIRDARGRELAMSVDVDSLYAVPAEIVDSHRTAVLLSPVLDMPIETLGDSLTRASSFVWLRRKLPAEVADAVRELDLRGLHFTRESERFYPKGELAASVLGFAGIDNQGLEGVEISFDEELRGERGRIRVEFDADNRQVPRALYTHEVPTPGVDLHLTIDEVLQYVAERELSRVVAEQSAEGGVVVLMEPATGRILAMASHPGFDPNHWEDADPSLWRNRAVSVPDHPGSVFKPITAAAAIDAGLITPDSEFEDPGYVRVPGATIRNWDLGSLGDTDFRTGFARSSNVVFAQVADELGIETFYEYLRSFGLDRKTGIALPGEADSIMPPEDAARPVDLAVMSYGQTLAVTPLQLAGAMSAIANGGELMRPLIVDRIVENGREEVTDPQVVRRVISPDTAATVRELMVYTVREGTGSNARIPGYEVGGKTGTAQKTVDGAVSEEEFISTFVGFAPADKPAVLCFVSVDGPKEDRFGSVVAAPIFREVVSEALRHMEVPPDFPEELLPDSETEEPDISSEDDSEEDSEEISVPDLRGLDLGEALAKLEEMGLEGAPSDEGERVADQFPSPETMLESGSRVILYPKVVEEEVDDSSAVTVPNVAGKTLREGAEILGEAGLRVEVSGSGLIRRQNPRAGTNVPSGSVIRLQLDSADR